MNPRKKKIEEIVAYLEKINPGDSTLKYSINQNIIFFNHLFSVRKFFRWVSKYVPQIESQKLLELTDFSLEKYNRELHQGMIKVERGFIPGFISPLVSKLAKYINKQNTDLLIADVGSGSSELTRQVIKRIMKNKKLYTVIIIAFDKSKASHEVARQNLKSLKIMPEIVETDFLSTGRLEEIRKAYKGKIVVVQTLNNIFNMSEDFKNTTFDLAYHSFFKHHLTGTQQQKIDLILKKIAKTTFEYDGIQSKAGIITQGLFTWKNPVLMNGAVLSNLKYQTKKQLKEKSNSAKLKIYKFGPFLTYRGTYLKTN